MKAALKVNSTFTDFEASFMNSNTKVKTTPIEVQMDVNVEMQEQMHKTYLCAMNLACLENHNAYSKSRSKTPQKMIPAMNLACLDF
jgi:hypothetical protein